MRLKPFAGLPLAVFILAAVMLILASPADAGIIGSGGGNLIINTVYNTVTNQFYQSVTADIGSLTTAFAVNPAEPLTTSNQDALTNIALGNLGLGASDIFNLLAQNILLSTTSALGENVSVAQTPDAIVIGDPANLSSDLNGTTLVVQGTVTVTDTLTTTYTQNYNLAVTSVPEPPTLWLAAVGLLAIVVTRRRGVRSPRMV